VEAAIVTTVLPHGQVLPEPAEPDPGVGRGSPTRRLPLATSETPGTPGTPRTSARVDDRAPAFGLLGRWLGEAADRHDPAQRGDTTVFAVVVFDGEEMTFEAVVTFRASHSQRTDRRKLVTDTTSAAGSTGVAGPGEVTWVRSSFARGDGVEIAQDGGTVLVRDSRAIGRQAFAFTVREWLEFIDGVKEGEFDPNG
jgi:hypothetical protein